MSVQVTLTISDALYRKARAQAQLTNQDPADILADAIVLGETPSMLTFRQAAMAKEKAAYQTLHAKLLANHKGKFVAIHQGKLVDQDEDQTTLLLRIRQHYPEQIVLITQVLPEADEVYTLRSPRLENGK